MCAAQALQVLLPEPDTQGGSVAAHLETVPVALKSQGQQQPSGGAVAAAVLRWEAASCGILPLMLQRNPRGAPIIRGCTCAWLSCRHLMHDH